MLQFRHPGGTSRGVLTEKETWLIELTDENDPSFTGTGECNLFRGLSADDVPGFEKKLDEVCQNINKILPDFHLSLAGFPSIRSGIEQALIHLQQKKKFIYFPSAFTSGSASMRINGLIWMGNYDFMCEQVNEKIEKGFSCIKIKIGAISIKEELKLLEHIRKNSSQIEIRLDANGAFTSENVLEKLKLYAEYNVHSVEQPIRQKQWEGMKNVCKNSPIPVALDEELIGVHTPEERKKLLDTIQPHYIILKPGLLGGFKSCEEWISLAQERKIKWWITSALESNIGLNAIAQWTFTLNNSMPQGLGTGSLYTNNFESPLELKGEVLRFNPEKI